VLLTGPGPRNRLRWAIHLIIVTALPVAAALTGADSAGNRGPALGHTVRGLLMVCAIQLSIFGVAFGLAWLASRASWDDLLLRWRGGFRVVPLGIAYSIAMRLALGLIVMIVVAFSLLLHLTTPGELPRFIEANRPDIDSLVDISALRHNPLYFWLSLTFVSFVVAGFREELWRSAFLAGLRSLWPRAFGSRYGQLGSVAVAAVFFGVAHLRQGLPASALLTFLGFALGLIMVFHRSIWPAVIAHGCFDAATFALLPLLAEKIHEITR